MPTLLEETLENWGFAREGVIAEVRNLSEKDLAWRPAEGSRTAGELVAHILESGALMAGELTRDDGDFRRRGYEALLSEHSRGIRMKGTKKQLLAELARTHKDGAARIRKAGEIHMLQQIRRFDGIPGTRLAWMQHGVGHEEYHRGQLALIARFAGRTPALTQLIQGDGD